MTKCTHLPMTKQLLFLLTFLNTWMMFVSMAHLYWWSALDWVEQRKAASLFSGSILSSYQKCSQGLQSPSAVHISLYDIRLLRDDGKEAATVTVRDEGHTLVNVTSISVTKTTTGFTYTLFTVCWKQRSGAGNHLIMTVLLFTTTCNT